MPTPLHDPDRATSGSDALVPALLGLRQLLDRCASAMAESGPATEEPVEPAFLLAGLGILSCRARLERWLEIAEADVEPPARPAEPVRPTGSLLR